MAKRLGHETPQGKRAYQIGGGASGLTVCVAIRLCTWPSAGCDDLGRCRTRILLQIFGKTVTAPAFFKFIRREGDGGFGKGKVKPVFESNRADQIARGC